MKNTCNCSDATVCEELPPVISGSKLLVLNDANCQRTLVPRPGSLVYSDGVGLYYADGSPATPIALPNLTNFQQGTGITIPSLLSRFAGGVIAAVNPDPEVDGLVLTSLAGEWTMAPIPAQLCFDPDEVLTECCCPLAFAVWVEDDSDPENPQMCLRSFNFCEDATNIESGSIMSCEPDTGCIRKLIGTSGDQVPAWDVETSTWIPTEISDLIPTPESVLDVAHVYWEYTDGGLPVGANTFNHLFGVDTSYTASSSGSIVSVVANPIPYDHSSLVIANTGWYEITASFAGRMISTVAINDPAVGVNWVELWIYRNGVPDQSTNASAVVLSTGAGPFEAAVQYNGTVTWASSLTALDKIDFYIIAKFTDLASSPPIYDADIYNGTIGTDIHVFHILTATITRIT